MSNTKFEEHQENNKPASAHEAYTDNHHSGLAADDTDFATRKEYFIHFIGYYNQMIRWIFFSAITGIVIGMIGAGFYWIIEQSTEYRMAHPLTMIGLPFAGLLIVFLYKATGRDHCTGTNMILGSIRAEEDIPAITAPLILIATILTHLFGGSSGREGAALQFGGSVANSLGKLFRLSDVDRRLLVMAGMAGAFSALFGTPLAAMVFSMEVVSIGVMYYAALLPCACSAFVARSVAIHLGVTALGIPYPVTDIPYFFSLNAWYPVLLGILCSLVGILFCRALKLTHDYYAKLFKNPYVRIFVAGSIVAGLTLLIGTQDYIGLGEQVIHRSFDTPQAPYVFVLKLVFTCLTLCAGFKGGEIVPSLFIGATMGSALSALLAFPTDLSTACGMVGMFCAVTNCPLTSLLIAFELFDFDGMPYYALVVAISYMLSGYYSLYPGQKIIYSKTKARFVNQHSHQ